MVTGVQTCALPISLFVLCEDTETSPLLDKRAEHLPRPYYYLFSQIQTGNDLSVSFDVLGLEVVEEVSSLTYHLKKASSGVMILLVYLEVLGKVVDSLSEDSDLYLGRTSIGLVSSVSFDNSSLFVFS